MKRMLVGAFCLLAPGAVVIGPPKTASSTRTLQFSGYEWKVKSSEIGRTGPGPNYFSDAKENAWVDDRGRLHLRVTLRDGRWYCAEIISSRSFGYGTYMFGIDGDIADIDPGVVLGLFTWSDSPAYSHREIDVEVSRFGNRNTQNAQFVIQPYDRPENIVRFEIPTGLRASTHSFTWRPDSVHFRSVKVPGDTSPNKSAILREHLFNRGIPRDGGENARINLWLFAGHRPAGGKDIEVVLSRFTFTPLD